MEMSKNVQASLQLCALLSINCNFHSAPETNKQVHLHKKLRFEKNKTRKTDLLRYKATKLSVYMLD